MKDAESAVEIIPSLIAPRTINLLGGQSGIGKTRFLLPTILTWLNTGQFLNIPATPIPCAWLMCDRSGASFARKLASLDLTSQWSHGLLPVVSWQDYSLNAEDSLPRIFRQLPANFRTDSRPKLLVVEAFQTLMDEGNANSYRDVARFFVKVNSFLNEFNCAILGTVHSPKMKQEEGYLRNQDRILGSVAWPVSSESLMFLESLTDDPLDSRRLLHIEPYASEAYDLKLDKDYKGRLTVVQSHAATDKDGWRQYFDTWLGAYDQEELPVQIVLDWMDSLNGISGTSAISRSTVFRWLDEKCRNGILQKIKKGVYKLRKAS